MTYCKIDVNNCSSSLLLSALAHFCSRLVLIFALGSCSFLLSARAHFCSRLVLNFALGSCSILLSARAHFCSQLVLIFVLGSCSLLLGNHRSYPFSLSNRCSYARPTGPPYHVLRKWSSLQRYTSESGTGGRKRGEGYRAGHWVL